MGGWHYVPYRSTGLTNPEDIGLAEYDREVRRIADQTLGNISTGVVRNGDSTSVTVLAESIFGGIQARGKCSRLPCDIEDPEMAVMIALGKALEKLAKKVKGMSDKMVDQNERRSEVTRRRATKNFVKYELGPRIAAAVTTRSMREICTGTD
jgi:hypothetical protein